jgi:hypothetical protein
MECSRYNIEKRCASTQTQVDEPIRIAESMVNFFYKRNIFQKIILDL